MICRGSHCSGYILLLKWILRLDCYFKGLLYIPSAASVVVFENTPPEVSLVLEKFGSTLLFMVHLMTTWLSAVQLRYHLFNAVFLISLLVPQNARRSFININSSSQDLKILKCFRYPFCKVLVFEKNIKVAFNVPDCHRWRKNFL